MKTAEELDSLAQQIYWHVEHGEQKKAIKKLQLIEIDALREAAEIADAQTDLPEDKIPNASIKNDPSYIIGIRRGNVNAANAILARAKELEAQ